MIWSTPSSRYAHVVARSADAGGIGYESFPELLAAMTEDIEGVEDDNERREDVVGDQGHC